MDCLFTKGDMRAAMCTGQCIDYLLTEKEPLWTPNQKNTPRTSLINTVLIVSPYIPHRTALALTSFRYERLVVEDIWQEQKTNQSPIRHKSHAGLKASLVVSKIQVKYNKITKEI